jgi:hypothetical protein
MYIHCAILAAAVRKIFDMVGRSTGLIVDYRLNVVYDD